MKQYIFFPKINKYNIVQNAKIYPQLFKHMTNSVLKKKQKQKHDKLKCLEKQSLDASKKHKLPKIGEKLGKMGVISILEEAPLEKGLSNRIPVWHCPRK